MYKAKKSAAIHFVHRLQQIIKTLGLLPLVSYMINSIIRSAINTAAQAQTATVRRLFSLYATISATISAAAPEMIPADVAVRIAGKVMAARHA